MTVGNFLTPCICVLLPDRQYKSTHYAYAFLIYRMKFIHENNLNHCRLYCHSHWKGLQPESRRPAVALQTSPGPWHSIRAPSVTRNSDARRGCPKCTARCPRVSSTCWQTPRIGWGVPRLIPALRPLNIIIEHGTAYSWPIHTVHTKRA